MVSIRFPVMYGTSNSTAQLQISGIPGSIQGAGYIPISNIYDNGNSYSGNASGSPGVFLIEFRNSLTGTSTTYTASGAKGLGSSLILNYTIQ